MPGASIAGHLAGGPHAAAAAELNDLYLDGSGNLVVRLGGATALTIPAAGGLTPAGVFLAPDGVVGAPAFAYASEPTSGWYHSTAGTVDLALQGVRKYIFQPGFLTLFDNAQVLAIGASQDVQIVRDAADALALRRALNPQEFRAYNTYADASNFERLVLRASATYSALMQQKLGTGVLRPMYIWNESGSAINFRVGAATDAWQINVAGSFSAFLAAAKIIGGATSLSLRNAADSADNLLVTDAGAVTMRGQLTGYSSPEARAYHSVDQSIGNATATALALNSERFDTDTIHDTVTNNTRMTCKTAGKYTLSASVAFAANGTGTRIVSFILNGATTIGSMAVPAASTSSLHTRLCPSTTYDLAVNDYVEVTVYQDSGGALNVVAAPNYSPEVSMVRVG